MGDYKIKHYQKGFEDEQARVGMEVAKSFEIPHQTPAERLRERYSQDDFDPETRLYAFKGDKVIGFLTSRVLEEGEDNIKTASLTPPTVLSEHKKAEELLFNKAIDILKNKGVEKIQSNFGAITKQNADDAKKWGYKFVRDVVFYYKVNLDVVDTSISFENLFDFNFDAHQEQCAKIIAEEYGQDIEWANNLFERIKNESSDIVRVTKVIEEDGQVKAFTGIVQNQIEPTIANMYVIYAADQKYMKQLLSFYAKFCKEKKYSRLQCGFTEETDILLAKYKPIKFELIGKAAQFEKEI
jgi:hypothetical protein